MRINVGLDFGTCYTKVAFFDMEMEKHYFFVFDKSKDNLGRYVFPSKLRINSDGRIFFAANKNMAFGGDTYYEFFKINMENTIRTLKINDKEYDIDDYKIVALYCSHILSKVRKYLNSKFDGPDLIFNFGIPLDHLGDNNENRERKFKLAFNLAEMMSRDHFIENADEVLEFLPILDELEREYNKIKKEELKVTVYPETIAGVATLLSTGSLSADVRYSIVDIGAGTTDVSFFEFTRNSIPGGKFHVYNSNTYNVGSENFVENDVDKSIKELRDSFRVAFGKTFSLAKEKWSNDFHLLFLGGGTRGDLREFTKNTEITIPSGNLFRNYINPTPQELYIPDNIVDCIDKEEESWNENFDILSIAYGLSYPKMMMPKYNPQVPERQRDVLRQTPEEPLTPDVG